MAYCMSFRHATNEWNHSLIMKLRLDEPMIEIAKSSVCVASVIHFLTSVSNGVRSRVWGVGTEEGAACQVKVVAPVGSAVGSRLPTMNGRLGPAPDTRPAGGKGAVIGIAAVPSIFLEESEFV